MRNYSNREQSERCHLQSPGYLHGASQSQRHLRLDEQQREGESKKRIHRSTGGEIGRKQDEERKRRSKARGACSRAWRAAMMMLHNPNTTRTWRKRTGIESKEEDLAERWKWRKSTEQRKNEAAVPVADPGGRHDDASQFQHHSHLDEQQQEDKKRKWMKRIHRSTWGKKGRKQDEEREKGAAEREVPLAGPGGPPWCFTMFGNTTALVQKRNAVRYTWEKIERKGDELQRKKPRKERTTEGTMVWLSDLRRKEQQWRTMRELQASCSNPCRERLFVQQT